MTLRASPLMLALLLLAACAATFPSSTPSPSLDDTASATASHGPLVGSWTRTQSCAQQLDAFDAAGITDSHVEYVTVRWVPEGTKGGQPHDFCHGARPPEEHSHFFTADGRFGSYDADGNQVDGGDYVIVDGQTLSFPSHAAEYGYPRGEVLVRYEVNGDVATFHVTIPTDCLGNCLNAYAWALSAFFDGEPWRKSN